MLNHGLALESRPLIIPDKIPSHDKISVMQANSTFGISRFITHYPVV
jgi:hypothetical protein